MLVVTVQRVNIKATIHYSSVKTANKANFHNRVQQYVPILQVVHGRDRL
jgi:hypothetical protein